MNFDDDDLDLGYTPSVVNNSRSAGMKKITRKSQSKPKQAPTVKKSSQEDDFDLLDQLLSPAKPKITTTKTVKEVNNNFKDDIDSFFDEPATGPANKDKAKPAANKNSWNDWGDSSNKNDSKVNTTANTSLNNRPQTAKGISTLAFDDIIQENPSDRPTATFKFKRPETAVNTTKKEQVEEDPIFSPSPSLRMMKPPLRKRQSSKDDRKSEVHNKSDYNKSESGFGLTLIPDEPKSTITAKNQQRSSLILPDQEKKVYPPIDNRRKPSVEINKVDYNLKLDDQPELSLNNKKQQLFRSPPYLSKDNKQPSLRLDSPQNKNNKAGLESFQKKNTSYSTNLNPPPPKNQSKLWEPERSYVVQEEKSNYLKIQSQQKFASHNEMQKQMQFIKKNYQKHIDTLQKNLQQQVKSNKQSRDRLMNQVNQLIDSQRSRLTKIHQEEIDRIKQMSEWEKKKVEENYKMQIDSLKSQLQRANVLNQSAQPQGYSSIQVDKKQIKYLEQKLRSQRRSLEDREKILDRRELALEQSERQFAKRRRHEEERLRDEEKRIFQTQMDSKKNLMHQRKALQEQKQAMAAEMASLELGNFKNAEISENMLADLQIQKREFQNQKKEIRDLQNQVMKDYRQKQQEMRKQKQNLARLQSELVHKLRIVQAKAHKDNITMANTTKGKTNKTINYKENTWVQDTSQQNIRPMSSEKMTQHKKIEETQNRFLHITQNLKDSLRASHKGSGGFDLDKYMMNMAKYTRTREQIC